MALITSGISDEGIQVLVASIGSPRPFLLRLPDVPPDFLRYVGFYYVSRLNASLGEFSQVAGLPLWTKSTTLTVPTISGATHRLSTAWRVSGLQWEVHDFT